jgi:hypothetical protein
MVAYCEVSAYTAESSTVSARTTPNANNRSPGRRLAGVVIVGGAGEIVDEAAAVAEAGVPAAGTRGWEVVDEEQAQSSATTNRPISA